MHELFFNFDETDNSTPYDIMLVLTQHNIYRLCIYEPNSEKRSYGNFYVPVIDIDYDQLKKLFEKE